MSRKAIIIGLLAVLLIVCSVYYFTDGFKNQLDGSVEFKCPSRFWVSQQIGDYTYSFTYYPETTYNGVTANAGHIMISRSNDLAQPSEFSLTPNMPRDYLGMTFTIKEVKPDYAIITAKTIT